MLTGTHVTLAPVTPALRSELARWLNDPRVLRTAGIGVGPASEADVARWYARLAGTPGEQWFAVVERASGRAVGFAGLRDIDWRHRTAEYAITIGAAEARGRGWGSEATRLLLAHAHGTLGLRNVLLDVAAYNLAGIRAYQRAGFREIGRRRACDLLGGRLDDVVYMESAASGRPSAVSHQQRVTGAGVRERKDEPEMEQVTDAPEPVLNIVGELVALGPATREQIPTYARWFSDSETMRTQGAPGPGPRTVEEVTTWYESEMSGNPSRAFFSVYERGTMRHIGFVDLQHIDHRNRTAEMSLMVGEPDARGRGYATEMARLILDYGFTALSLHNIMLEVYANNPAARRVYEKAGFREFARRSESYFMDGQWWDRIYMEALATEFASPLLARVFAPDEPRGDARDER